MLTLVTRTGARAALRVLPSRRALRLAETLERAGHRVVVLRHGRVVQVRDPSCGDAFEPA